MTEKGAMAFIISSLSALFYKLTEFWRSSLVLGGKQQGVSSLALSQDSSSLVCPL